jgi:hypothetical protein
MKLGKRSRWMIIFVILLISLAIFLTRVDSVQATLDDMHAATVLLRVENEIMQKTPAGQYYDSLFWKHADEVGEIMNSHHDHVEVLRHAINVFIPELEALLEGAGDTVYITSEHVKSLEAELNWFASMGSPALREDIQKEQQRFPLDNFVGMTMSKALDFINSSWTPDMVIQQTSVPAPVVEQTLTPYLVMQPTSTPQFVADSDRKWAYYVHNGVYFEYPTSYYLEVSESNTSQINLMPFADVPEQTDPQAITIHIWKAPYAKKDKLRPDYWYPAARIVWENTTPNEDFEGIEFVANMQHALDVHLTTVQYNRENQLAVEIIFMYTKENPSDNFDYSGIINQRYEYFEHMVHSLRIQIP